MIVYLLLLILIITESFVWFFIKKNKITKLIFSILPAVFLYVIFSFRSVDVGRDTITYYEKFLKLTSISQISIFSDPGFYFTAFLVRNITSNFNIFLSLMGLIIFVPLFFVIFKKCNNPGIGYLIFSFTCLSMMLSALRQTIAMGFCMIALLLYFNDKIKKLFCIIPIIVAITFHSSAVIFLLCIPFLFLKPNTRMLVFMVFMAFIFAFMGNSFGTLLAQLSITFYGVNSNLTNIPELGIYCFACSFIFVLCWEKNAPYQFVSSLFKKIEIKRLSETISLCESNEVETSRSLLPGFLLSFFMLLSSSNNVFPRMSIFFIPFFIISSNALSIKTSKVVSFISSTLFVLASVAIFVYLFLYSDRLDCVPYSFL